MGYQDNNMTMLQFLPIALVSLFATCQLHAADAAVVRVPTVTAGQSAAGVVMDFDAVLQPVRQATVTAQVAGNVLALSVKAGDTVRRKFGKSLGHRRLRSRGLRLAQGGLCRLDLVLGVVECGRTDEPVLLEFAIAVEHLLDIAQFRLGLRHRGIAARGVGATLAVVQPRQGLAAAHRIAGLDA